MIISSKKFSKILFSLVAIIFVLSAQSGVQPIPLCYDKDNGNVYRQVGGGCPSELKFFSLSRGQQFFCMAKFGGDVGYQPNTQLLGSDGSCAPDITGNPAILRKVSDLEGINSNNVITKSPTSTTFGGDTTTTTTTTTKPTTTPTPKPTTKPSTGSSNTTTQTTKPQVRGNCEAGFHKSGVLCLPDNPYTKSTSILNTGNVNALIARIISYALYFSGSIAILFIIYGGYLFITAGANESQAKDGKKTLTNALIGLAIVLLSYVVVSILFSFLGVS
jgi:hypothetical protein